MENQRPLLLLEILFLKRGNYLMKSKTCYDRAPWRSCWKNKDWLFLALASKFIVYIQGHILPNRVEKQRSVCVKYPLHADAIYKAVHRNYEPKVRTVCLAEGRGRLTEFMMRRGRSQRWIARETYRYESPCEQRTPPCPVLKMTILRPLPPVPAAQALRPGHLKKFTPSHSVISLYYCGIRSLFLLLSYFCVY